jgi:hypothetical protein
MQSTFRTMKAFVAGAMVLLLVGCAADTGTAPALKATEPLGDFKLGIMVVYADKVQQGPMSRDATPLELKTALETELRRRFGSLTGSKFFNMSVAIDAYALAKPGIPLIISPKSALVVTLNVWDDAKQQIITEEDKRFTVLEKFTGKSLIGSGMTMSREEQLAELVQTTADNIEAYMRENEALFVAN